MTHILRIIHASHLGFYSFAISGELCEWCTKSEVSTHFSYCVMTIGNRVSGIHAKVILFCNDLLN